jgi:hypothetical protein
MLRAGRDANACRTVHGRARAALAPAPYFRKDRLVMVMIIFLLFRCVEARDHNARPKHGKERHFWLRIFTANAVPDFSRPIGKFVPFVAGSSRSKFGDFRRGLFASTPVGAISQAKRRDQLTAALRVARLKTMSCRT